MTRSILWTREIDQKSSDSFIQISVNVNYHKITSTHASRLIYFLFDQKFHLVLAYQVAEGKWKSDFWPISTAGPSVVSPRKPVCSNNSLPKTSKQKSKPFWLKFAYEASP